jgi:hypothetical protein
MSALWFQGLSILIKIYGFSGIRSLVLKKKIIEIRVSIVTALYELLSFWFIQVLNVLLKSPGRNRLLRETLKISLKKGFLAILERIYFIILKTIVTDLRTYFVVNKSYKTFSYLENSRRNRLLRQKMTLFWSSFLIGRAISDL